MAGLFDRVKTLVNIKDYISLEIGVEAKRSGKAWRLNPCPFCDHKDCFTVNEREQFFKCFSCQTKGDIIEFERQYRNLDSPLEAVKSIAEKRNIPIQDELARTIGRNPPTPIPPEKRKPADTPKVESAIEIDSDRALAVRQVVADYYHDRLISSQKTLSYQMDVRLHSRQILDQLKVGLGGGGLIPHCRSQSVSVEELLSLGLLQKLKNDAGLRSTISGGVYVYPHFKGEDILFFTLKDPEKKKRWQLKKAFAPDGWLCYGQDVLEQTEKPVVIVEGENDRITVMDLGKYDQVMATISSYNEPAILERLKGIAKGRTWYLAFDNDPPPPPPKKPEGAGARYIRVYANALLTGGGDVRVIRIREMGTDIDDVLRAAEEPAVKFAQMMDGAEKINKLIPAPDDPGKGGSSGWEPPPEGAYYFNSFEVLGELQDERLLFWSKINERLYSVGLKDLQLDKLVQIGGLEVATKIARQAKTAQPGQLLFGSVKKRLIVQAGKRQLWDPEYLGQGLHGLGERLLLVVGGRAWVWNNKRLEEWKHPVIENRLIDWRQGYNWVEIPGVLGLIKQMDMHIANKILEELLGIFVQWQFSGKLDVWLLTGWYLAQWVQSIWAWRPHLWMTGTSGSGKSIMRELMTILGGRLALPCEGQTLTEPGLRQGIGCDSVLVAIDEIEKSEHRDKIIYFIRSAGRGGITRKGSSSQRAVVAQLKHMVFLGSVERGLYRAAENSRYLTVETKKSDDCHPKFPNTSDASKIRTKIVAYVIWASFRAKDLVSHVGKIGESDPRFVESLAVALSMIAVSFTKPEQRLTQLLTDYLKEWSERFEAGTLEDEAKLAEDIMMAQVRLPEEIEGDLRTNGYETTKTVYVTRTVSQLIQAKSDMADEPKKLLEAHGVKVWGEFGLFLHPDTVVRRLLRQTQWHGLNIRDMLLRITGAQPKQLRLGGSALRGVLIPWGGLGL